ncbi:MAG: hypothetical protein SGILL_002249, partial [Bacillariaceae sp.]
MTTNDGDGDAAAVECSPGDEEAIEKSAMAFKEPQGDQEGMQKRRSSQIMPGSRLPTRTLRRDSSAMFRSFVLNGLNLMTPDDDDEINFEGSYHQSIVFNASSAFNLELEPEEDHPPPPPKGLYTIQSAGGEIGEDDSNSEKDRLGHLHDFSQSIKTDRRGLMNRQRASLMQRQSSSKRFRNFVWDLDMTPDNESINFSSSGFDESGIDFMSNDTDDDEEGTFSDSEVEYRRATPSSSLFDVPKASKENSDEPSASSSSLLSSAVAAVAINSSPKVGENKKNPAVVMNAMHRIRKANALILQQQKRRRDSMDRQKLLDLLEVSSVNSCSSVGSGHLEPTASPVAFVGDVYCDLSSEETSNGLLSVARDTAQQDVSKSQLAKITTDLIAEKSRAANIESLLAAEKEAIADVERHHRETVAELESQIESEQAARKALELQLSSEATKRNLQEEETARLVENLKRQREQEVTHSAQLESQLKSDITAEIDSRKRSEAKVVEMAEEMRGKEKAIQSATEDLVCQLQSEQASRKAMEEKLAQESAHLLKRTEELTLQLETEQELRTTMVDKAAKDSVCLQKTVKELEFQIQASQEAMMTSEENSVTEISQLKKKMEGLTVQLKTETALRMAVEEKAALDIADLQERNEELVNKLEAEQTSRKDAEEMAATDIAKLQEENKELLSQFKSEQESRLSTETKAASNMESLQSKLFLEVAARELQEAESSKLVEKLKQHTNQEISNAAQIQKALQTDLNAEVESRQCLEDKLTVMTEQLRLIEEESQDLPDLDPTTPSEPGTPSPVKIFTPDRCVQEEDNLSTFVGGRELFPPESDDHCPRKLSIPGLRSSVVSSRDSTVSTKMRNIFLQDESKTAAEPWKRRVVRLLIALLVLVACGAMGAAFGYQHAVARSSLDVAMDLKQTELHMKLEQVEKLLSTERKEKHAAFATHKALQKDTERHKREEAHHHAERQQREENAKKELEGDRLRMETELKEQKVALQQLHLSFETKKASMEASLADASRTADTYRKEALDLAEQLRKKVREESRKVAERKLEANWRAANAEAAKEAHTQREQRRQQRRMKVKEAFLRGRFMLRSLVLWIQKVSYSTAKAVGFEIKQFAGAAELLSQRAGGFASSMAGKTLSAAQHANEVAGQVASTNAKIRESTINLSGSEESFAFIMQVGSEKLSHANDVASELAAQQAKIQASSHSLGDHNSL